MDEQRARRIARAVDRMFWRRQSRLSIGDWHLWEEAHEALVEDGRPDTFYARYQREALEGRGGAAQLTR